MASQHPGIGRIVHVFVDPKINNGANIAPAMITRVWSDRMVNVRVIRDHYEPFVPVDWMTSIPLYETRKDAEQDFANMTHSLSECPQYPFAAFWPERV